MTGRDMMGSVACIGQVGGGGYEDLRVGYVADSRERRGIGRGARRVKDASRDGCRCNDKIGGCV